ncbi:flagellin [Sagittula sp. NFXS13]|uniref:Flagellin n=1 Tax=Sagittula marina TaxID=943940 RepID=A0A7W6GTW6_9RHOB|nr:flagellin [Sagittula marina]MBB3985654.1 flagellin [Sagittula marina]
MSSILTNNGATAALQTLKNINKSMGNVQEQISTGKRVNSSKDNAAVWAISTAMESDVAGFKKVSESLSLGQATVSVARQGAETVADLLTQVKEKVVSAQEENVDRAKIQTDIAALRDQITAVVGASQFNGQYMLENTGTAEDSGGINVLASLDRSFSGVSSSDIRVSKEDLSQGAATAGSVSVDASLGNTVVAGESNDVATFVEDTAGGLTTGNTYQFTSGGNLALSEDVAYVAREGDTLEDVTNGLVMKLNEQAAADGLDVTFSQSDTGVGTISMTNNTDADIAVAAGEFQQAALDGSEDDGGIGGRLEVLASMDVSTQAGTDSALAVIDGLIEVAIDSAAAFGSSEMRLETQADFVSGLTDALKSGIGTLVDADMEETSARLQALQVQQQLGIQAMSIANSAPQSLLGLFR